MHGDDGQRIIYKESQRITKPGNIQDHSCISNNKTEEQVHTTAEKY